MKTIDYLIFWAVFCLVTIPVIFGLMIDQISYGLFAVAWAAIWWAIFTRTELGRKALKKGSQIASDIMGNCDV